MTNGIVKESVKVSNSIFPEERCTILYQLGNKLYRKTKVFSKGQIYNHIELVYRKVEINVNGKKEVFWREYRSINEKPTESIKRKPGRPKGSKNKQKRGNKKWIIITIKTKCH